MPPRIIFSPDAVRELDGIFEYIAQDSPFYAGQVVDDIYARTQILLTQPEVGRIIPERKDGVSR
jgi:plasmid stabilization system protein ParE